MKKLISLLIIPLISPLFVPLIFPFNAHAQGIIDGDLIRAINAFDVYIVKLIDAEKYKRLILNPEIFNQYGHLKWENIKTISQSELDDYTASDLVRAVSDDKVYKLYPNGDTGEKRWIKTAEDFSGFGYNAYAIYEINSFERDYYAAGADLTYQAPVVTPPVVPEVPARSNITINVPSDYSTIQAAINASIDGDTILVSMGVYNENIIIDKKIKLTSNNTAGVVINGGGTGNVITIKNSDILIQRFAIKSQDKYGVYCESGSVTIKNAYIIDSGWGVVAENNCQITLLNNLIYNNKKADKTDGAGVLIKDNFSYSITSEIRNNVITDNYHGIWSENSNTKALNNIITKNAGGIGSEESAGIYHSGLGKSDNYYNDVWSNGANYKGDALIGNGSLIINPKFVNEDQREYKLQTWTTDYSPCINTGHPEAIYYDGLLITDNDYRNDMGAYGGPDNIGWTP